MTGLSVEAYHQVAALLTPQELEAVQLAQNYYGARAKGAAAAFGEAIGLDDESRQQFVGRVAIGIEGRDADVRQRVGNQLIGHTARVERIGHGALDAVAIEEPLATVLFGDVTDHAGFSELFSISRNQSTNDTRMHLARPLEQRSGLTDGDQSETTATEPTETRVQQEAPRLSSQQRKWLSGLFGEEQVRQIESLPVHRRLDFAAQIGKIYSGIRSQGLNAERKQRRVEQLFALMGGKSYKEIAAEHGSTYAGVYMGLGTMAETIASRARQEDLFAAIPAEGPIQNRGTVSPKLTEENGNSGAEAMKKHQESWLRKIFSQEDVTSMREYTDEQRDVLAESLARYLRSFIVRLDKSKFKADRRVSQMTLLIQGKTYEEIAETVSQPVAAVKHDLHRSASSLHNRLKERDVARIVELAASGRID